MGNPPPALKADQNILGPLTTAVTQKIPIIPGQSQGQACPALPPLKHLTPHHCVEGQSPLTINTPTPSTHPSPGPLIWLRT